MPTYECELCKYSTKIKTNLHTTQTNIKKGILILKQMTPQMKKKYIHQHKPAQIPKNTSTNQHKTSTNQHKSQK